MKSPTLKEERPEGEMPRERLLRFGAGALGNAELLAILLRTGRRGENVLQMAENLLRRHGGLRGLGRLPVPELVNTPGIGTAKGTQLSAALELAARLAREQTQGVPLDSPERIYEAVVHDYAALGNESLRVLLCDARMRLTAFEEVSKGSNNETVACIPDIIRPAILRNAHAFIVVHNHPSGDPHPSHADVAFTKRLKETCELMSLRLTDHLIVGTPSPVHPRYYSFQEHGLL